MGILQVRWIGRQIIPPTLQGAKDFLRVSVWLPVAIKTAGRGAGLATAVKIPPAGRLIGFPTQMAVNAWHCHGGRCGSPVRAGQLRGWPIALTPIPVT